MLILGGKTKISIFSIEKSIFSIEKSRFSRRLCSLHPRCAPSGAEPGPERRGSNRQGDLCHRVYRHRLGSYRIDLPVPFLVTPLFYGWHFQAGTFFRIDIFQTVLPTGFHPAPPTHPNSNDLLSTRWSIHFVLYPRQNRDFKKIDTVPVYTRTRFRFFFWDKISKISAIRNGTLSIWSLTESLGP